MTNEQTAALLENFSLRIDLLERSMQEFASHQRNEIERHTTELNAMLLRIENGLNTALDDHKTASAHMVEERILKAEDDLHALRKTFKVKGSQVAN